MKMICIIVCILLFSVNVYCEELDGNYWKGLSEHKQSSLVFGYKHGYCDGHGVGMADIANYILKRDLSSPEEFQFLIDAFSKICGIKSSQIEKGIDTFYNDQKNTRIPIFGLFGAFTLVCWELEGFDISNATMLARNPELLKNSPFNLLK